MDKQWAAIVESVAQVTLTHLSSFESTPVSQEKFKSAESLALVISDMRTGEFK